MSNESIDFIARQIVSLKHQPGQLFHLTDGELKDSLAVLVNKMQSLVYGLMSCGMETAAAWHIELLTSGAVNLVVVIENTVLIVIARLEQDNTGAIAEEDECGAILGVENAGHDIGTDDQDFVVPAGFDELCPSRQCKEE